jgi:hypothetical protein
MKLIHLAALGLVALVAGCATVTITNQWRDPNWAGPPASHVVVIGISNSDAMRRIFEDTFVQQLQAAGITAAASYTQIAPNDTSVKLSDLIKSSGAEAILVTRVLRVQQRINVTPSGPGWGGPGWGGPGRGGFYGWYGNAWAQTQDVSVTEEVFLETTVWDARTQSVVWTVTTQSIASNNIPRATTDLASTLIPKLKADGILR